MFITHTEDAEEEARVLDLECVRRMTGTKAKKPEQKHENLNQDGRCKRPPLKIFKGKLLPVWGFGASSVWLSNCSQEE